MARPVFHVTYDIVTPESAEHGDYAEAGFVQPGEWHVSADKGDESGMTLREAARLCYPQEDAGSWFAEVDGRVDYRTGAEERRSLHPPRNITAASYDRLAKLLGF